MKSSDQFTIKQSSKLYKFYNNLYKFTLFDMYHPMNIFTDVCTFLRTNIISLFGILPTLIVVVTFLILTLVVAPITTIVSYFTVLPIFFEKLAATGAFIWLLYLSVTLIFTLLYLWQKLTNTSNIFIQAVKDKHSKICRQITVEEDTTNA